MLPTWTQLVLSLKIRMNNVCACGINCNKNEKKWQTLRWDWPICNFVQNIPLFILLLPLIHMYNLPSHVTRMLGVLFSSTRHFCRFHFPTWPFIFFCTITIDLVQSFQELCSKNYGQIIRAIQHKPYTIILVTKSCICGKYMKQTSKIPLKLFVAYLLFLHCKI